MRYECLAHIETAIQLDNYQTAELECAIIDFIEKKYRYPVEFSVVRLVAETERREEER